MTAVNDGREPTTDYSEWMPAPEPAPAPRRWCPTHRRYERNPPGRLRCGLAWKELYDMEREAEMERMSPNTAIMTLADRMGELIAEMGYRGVIADPPPRPQPPRPHPAPPPMLPRGNGRGGVAL